MKRGAVCVLSRPSIEPVMFDIPLHLLIIHFPIALTIVAFSYDGWAVYAKRPELNDVGYGLTLWAGVFALTSVVTGLQIAGLAQIGKGPVTEHALYGIFSSIVLAVVGFLRYSARAKQQGPDENYSILWLVLQAVAVLLIVTAVITGHRLVVGLLG